MGKNLVLVPDVASSYVCYSLLRFRRSGGRVSIRRDEAREHFRLYLPENLLSVVSDTFLKSSPAFPAVPSGWRTRSMSMLRTTT